jgi:hypothetical protein
MKIFKSKKALTWKTIVMIVATMVAVFLLIMVAMNVLDILK